MCRALRLAPAPAGISSVEAACLVVAGTTALLALRETVRLSSGERVLIRGAAGGVGTAAVQLAHAIGARCVIPCHFDLFEFNTASPDEFVAECRRLGQPYRLLRHGESWDFNKASEL